MYRCIKKFYLQTYDNNGFAVGIKTVEEGTIWDIPNDDYRFIGGEIRLENNDLGWVEITAETLKEYFEKIA